MSLQFNSCSFDFLENLQKILIEKTNIENRIYLKEIKLSKSSYPTKNKFYELKFYNKNAIKCCNFIFNKTTDITRLDRKYKIYLEYKKYKESRENIK